MNSRASEVLHADSADVRRHDTDKVIPGSWFDANSGQQELASVLFDDEVRPADRLCGFGATCSREMRMSR